MATDTTPTLSNTAAQMTRRWSKALRLVAAGRVQETSTPNCFRAVGDSGVWLAELNSNSCNCPDHEHRQSFCAHLFAATILSAHLRAVETTAELGAARTVAASAC